MKELDAFCIKGSPNTRTAQQKGLRVFKGHAQFYEKKEVAEAKADLADALLSHVPDEPYKGDICLRVLWCFCKTSLSRKEQRTFKRSRPDLDNMVKGLLDVMVDVGFFEDDSYIVKLDLTKSWNVETPGLFIQILELDDTENDYVEQIEQWRLRV